jgi:hypothetical protein
LFGALVANDMGDGAVMKRFGRKAAIAIGLLLWIPMLILAWQLRSVDDGPAARQGNKLEIVKETDRNKLLAREPRSNDRLAPSR